MEVELTYSEALDALELLDIDPDRVDHILSEVLHNRRQLKRVRDSWNEELNGIVGEHAPEDAEVVDLDPPGDDADDEEVDEWWDDCEYHPMEVQVGVELADPAEADEEVAKRLGDTVTVQLATVSADDIMNIDGVSEDWDALDPWSFMIDAFH